MSPAPEQKQTPISSRAPDPATFVPVRTTLPRRPLPLNAARIPIVTDRLILRPLSADDTTALRTYYHNLPVLSLLFREPSRNSVLTPETAPKKDTK
jgi:hypothetical protein